ncbi:hypothetical protein HT102_14035 [Hoyosella sp. G463]|uniref:Uncharacterized protein n=1 Tax=Lolliginicoccus lacisalsi TaxID=2742202 RepID=A0A927JF37_9ACTN|nr:hypothetical protein [Lolliginicoccus lacisalsi]MBD8507602.1 hypothetical protein [Lolliginicoccus lacisalsi]
MVSTRPRLQGDERFLGLAASVRDFWAFALSDLRGNTTRGYLAEFLVAQAMGSQQTRVEWDAYDVRAPDGTTIEVKSSGYSQSWPTNTQPVITFSGLPGARTKVSWDASANSYRTAFIADVYVFAVHTTLPSEPYDPLDIDAWRFYVLPGAAIASTGQSSMRLSTVEKLGARPVGWNELADEVRRALTRQAEAP